MTRFGWALCILLVGALLGGCSAEKKTTEEEADETARIVQEEVGEGAEAAVAKADELLAKVLDYIKENKLDDAQKQLKALEDMKSSLPKDLQEKIEQARKSLDAAKAGTALKDIELPKLD